MSPLLPSLNSSDTVLLMLAGICALLFFALLYYRRKVDHLQSRLEAQDSRSRSLSTVYGQISEQWFPLMDRYPYDSRGFRFLGAPVDGIQFEEDRIIFCEFKSNRSALSPSQKRIKQLIQDGKIYWEEFHFRAE